MFPLPFRLLTFSKLVVFHLFSLHMLLSAEAMEIEEESGRGTPSTIKLSNPIHAVINIKEQGKINAIKKIEKFWRYQKRYQDALGLVQNYNFGTEVKAPNLYKNDHYPTASWILNLLKKHDPFIEKIDESLLSVNQATGGSYTGALYSISRFDEKLEKDRIIYYIKCLRRDKSGDTGYKKDDWREFSNLFLINHHPTLSRLSNIRLSLIEHFFRFQLPGERGEQFITVSHAAPGLSLGDFYYKVIPPQFPKILSFRNNNQAMNQVLEEFGSFTARFHEKIGPMGDLSPANVFIYFPSEASDRFFFSIIDTNTIYDGIYGKNALLNGIFKDYNKSARNLSLQEKKENSKGFNLILKKHICEETKFFKLNQSIYELGVRWYLFKIIHILTQLDPNLDNPISLNNEITFKEKAILQETEIFNKIMKGYHNNLTSEVTKKFIIEGVDELINFCAQKILPSENRKWENPAIFGLIGAHYCRQVIFDNIRCSQNINLQQDLEWLKSILVTKEFLKNVE